MSWIRRIVFGYLVTISIVFLMGYLILGIREMGLYLFLIFINLPGSLVVVPKLESLCEAFGWTAGQPAHVWTTQLVCMVVNGALIATMMVIVSKVLKMTNPDLLKEFLRTKP